MEYKNLTKPKIEKIKNIVYDNINKEELRNFHNHYKDYFNKPISFKRFKNIFIDYILNGFEGDNSLKVFDDYDFIENEKNYRIELFKEEIKQKSTEELIKFNEENEEFNNFEYLDYDFILDDLKNRFNQNNNDFYNNYNNYNNDLYLKINALNGIFEDLEYYKNFKEFLGDLDSLIYNNPLNNLENLFLNFIKDYHFKDFNNKDSYKENQKRFIELNKEIEKDIKTTLKNRENLYIKDNRKINLKLRDIKTENHEQTKPIIKKSLLSYKAELENIKKRNKDELKEIRDFLK